MTILNLYLNIGFAVAHVLHLSLPASIYNRRSEREIICHYLTVMIWGLMWPLVVLWYFYYVWQNF